MRVCLQRAEAAGSLPLRCTALFGEAVCESGAALTVAVAVAVEGGIKRCRFNDVPRRCARLRGRLPRIHLGGGSKECC